MPTNLTDQQVNILLGLFTFAGVVVGLLLTGLGHLIKRRITGAKTQERATLFTTLADLKSKMSGAGVGLSEIQEMENLLKHGAPLSETSFQAIVGEPGTSTSEEKVPDSYHTTYAMNARAAARLGVIDAQINEAIVDLQTLASDTEEALLEKEQEAWLEYRRAHMSFAGARFEGGTLAPLWGVSAGINLAEERLKRLQDDAADRKRNGY